MAQYQKEPNKYAKNKGIQPESKMSVLIAVIRMSLMLAGIIVISIDIFRPNSWLKVILGKIFDSGSSLILIAVIVLILLYINYLISSPNKSSKKKIGDLPMYTMMLIGAIYVFNFVASSLL